MPWNLGPSDTGTLVDIVKDIAGFDTAGDRVALMSTALGLSQRARDAVSSLDFSGAREVFARRVISHLNSFGQIESGEQSLELFLTKLVVPKVDLPVGQEIHDIINRCKTVPKQPPPQPGSAPPGDFDPRIEDVKKAIRTNLNKIKNCNVLDENENEVWILDLVSTELGCDCPQPGEDLSERIPAFLTARCVRKIS